MAELRQFIRAENDPFGFELFTVGFGEKSRHLRYGRKHRLVQTEHEREFQLRVARTVDRAEEHVIERGRDHADGQSRQASFENREPFLERKRLAGKGQFNIFQPPVHLVPNGGMHRICQP